MVKTARPCHLAIAQKLTSKLLYLVGFHFKTHFPKLKIPYFYGKNPFNFSFHSKYFGLLWVNSLFTDTATSEIRLLYTEQASDVRDKDNK